MKMSDYIDKMKYEFKKDSAAAYFSSKLVPVFNHKEIDFKYNFDKTSSSFGNEINDIKSLSESTNTSLNAAKSDEGEINLIVNFIYKQLISEDFSYGDDPSVRYVSEEFFMKNGASAEMAFINMSSEKIYTSDSSVIEKFFALLMAIDEELIKKIVKPIILMFSSSAEESSAEGALILLEKFGRTEDDLNMALRIRDFDYEYLNDYKREVISSIEEKIK